MNNIIYLKFGTLKSYYFDESFVEKHKKEVENLDNVWNRIYENSCSTFGGSQETRKNKELKQDIVKVLKSLFDLGVVFENGFDDTYYNSFEEIKDYILNYGEEN